jgi:UPF0755 protein
MKKLILTLFYIILIAGIAFTVFLWAIVLRQNVKAEEPVRIYVPSGSDFTALTDTLESAGVLRSRSSFVLTSRLKSFGRSVKPGSYIIEPGMSNNNIVNVLRSGRQAPVNVTFNNIRTLEELAGKIGRQLETDSVSISAFFSDETNYADDGFTRNTLISVFIPDTYQLYWSVDARGFYRRMLKEYRDFWTEERKVLAEEHGLTPAEVSVLASIVDEEASREDEKPRIAGVYINRLRQGMPLQADPTVKFAVNNFSLRRILNKHLEVDSPYNTYKYPGLPPGPIRCPSRSGLESVLKAESHEYLFFVARYDGSGYHHFSRTLAEHNRYAAAYRRELNRRRIYQ